MISQEEKIVLSVLEKNPEVPATDITNTVVEKGFSRREAAHAILRLQDRGMLRLSEDYQSVSLTRDNTVTA